uniref:Uncharacterized protein n=1 Tax=Anguilla anguilla TaxID=7936 RepID=A0A0E9PZ05_ANGAN
MIAKCLLSTLYCIYLACLFHIL